MMARAAVFQGPGTFEVIEKPAPPDPGPGEVLVKVGAVGVCGSDMHSFKEGHIGPTPIPQGTIMGHEAGGWVEKVGEGVEHLKPGDVVAIEPAMSCGHCEQCRKGNPNLCYNIKFLGLEGIEGALQEYIVHPAHDLFKVAPNMDVVDAAILEPLGVGLYANDLADIQLGDTVAIIGAGPIGIATLQFAALRGASKIIVLEKLGWRLEHAMDLGADEGLLVNADGTLDDATMARFLEMVGGDGTDVVIEATGTEDGMSLGPDLAKRGGKLVWIGIPGDDIVSFKSSSARRKDLVMKYTRRMKFTYPRAIALAAAGKLDPKAMVTHTFPLEGTQEAFDTVADYQDGVIKAVIRVDQ